MLQEVAKPNRLPRPRPVDVHVGRRVRLRRTMLGLSQEKLGEAIGLTFQQVQKYERGANRIGASRLYELSQILEVPVSFFFDDMPAEVAETGGRPASSPPREGPESYGYDPMVKRETLELVRAYYKIKDPNVRKSVFDLVKSMGKSEVIVD